MDGCLCPGQSLSEILKPAANWCSLRASCPRWVPGVPTRGTDFGRGGSARPATSFVLRRHASVYPFSVCWDVASCEPTRSESADRLGGEARGVAWAPRHPSTHSFSHGKHDRAGLPLGTNRGGTAGAKPYPFGPSPVVDSPPFLFPNS